MSKGNNRNKDLYFKRVEFWQGKAVYCKKTNTINFILFEFKNNFIKNELKEAGFENNTKNKNVWSKEFCQETVNSVNKLLDEIDELFSIIYNSNFNEIRYNSLMEWLSKREKRDIGKDLIYKESVIEVYSDFFLDFYHYAMRRYFTIGRKKRARKNSMFIKREEQ